MTTGDSNDETHPDGPIVRSLLQIGALALFVAGSAVFLIALGATLGLFAALTGLCLIAWAYFLLERKTPIFTPRASPRRRFLDPRIDIERTLVLVCVLGPLIAFWLYPHAGRGPGLSPSGWCGLYMTRMTHALRQYHDVYDCFPPVATLDSAGRPLHSWRTLVLPYLELEQQQLYAELHLDEAWNSNRNQAVIDGSFSSYVCPETRGEHRHTNYLVVVGEDTAWPPGKSRLLSEITDDLSTTILLVEVAGSDIQWTEPRDLSLTELDLHVNGRAKNSISSAHDDGANVVFVDGNTAFLPNDTPPEVIKAMLTINGGELIETDWRGRYRLVE